MTTHVDVMLENSDSFELKESSVSQAKWPYLLYIKQGEQTICLFLTTPVRAKLTELLYGGTQ